MTQMPTESIKLEPLISTTARYIKLRGIGVYRLPLTTNFHFSMNFFRKLPRKVEISVWSANDEIYPISPISIIEIQLINKRIPHLKKIIQEFCNRLRNL